jgi:hypothetical protein
MNDARFSPYTRIDRAIAGLVVKWRAEAKRCQIAAAELSRDEGVEAFERLMHEIEERRLLQCASDLLTLLDKVESGDPGGDQT